MKAIRLNVFDYFWKLDKSGPPKWTTQKILDPVYTWLYLASSACLLTKMHLNRCKQRLCL